MSENKDKKINLLKQMKDEGLITEQEYNEKIAIVEKEKKENKKTKQTTTKNNKKAKEKDASPNNEQATEEKEQGFWKQVKKQLKEDKGCFFGMNAIECFLYSTIVFFASLIVLLIVPKNLNALMYGSIITIVSLVQCIILYSYNRKELIEYYKKTSLSELFSTVFPQIKEYLRYAVLIMIGFVIFCFVFYNHSIIGANANDDNEITPDLWCGLYTGGLASVEGDGTLYVFKNDLKEDGSSICPPPNQCDMGFTLEGYVGVDMKFPNKEYAKEWKKYEKTCVIINGRMRFNEFWNRYEIHNPRFLNYAY